MLFDKIFFLFRFQPSFYECLWSATFSKGWTSSTESLPVYVLCSCNLLNRGIWGFCTRYLAGSTFHGCHDWDRLDCFTHTVRAARIHLDGEAETWWIILFTSGSKWKTCGSMQHDPSVGHYYGLPQWILRTSATTGAWPTFFLLHLLVNLYICPNV